MRIYTKTGDRGETGLFGGSRVSKSALRVCAYGEIDELGALIGLARASLARSPIDVTLEQAQRDLFALGAELASQPGKDAGIAGLGAADTERLERAIDAADELLPALGTFVLAGGAEGAARLHVARCVCRRAERTLVALARTEPVRDELLAYVNRLSDTLFTLARLANHEAGVPDVPWLGRGVTSEGSSR